MIYIITRPSLLKKPLKQVLWSGQNPGNPWRSSVICAVSMNAIDKAYPLETVSTPRLSIQQKQQQQYHT